jgi:hypothetical protein
MSEKPTYFIETEDGDFVVVDEYGDPILDDNGKVMEYTGEDRYKSKEKIYVVRDRRNNYTRNYMDNVFKKKPRKRR